ncbi:uncharacterized protein [Onthophagus taurus]|uniref:uncharacterized protein n=1 Tax=Onthophagus taurus TaxID=166361 RepID=UPI000C207D6A|nr:uncharacterized protein LOC111426627 [Onthophagus taurus]
MKSKISILLIIVHLEFIKLAEIRDGIVRYSSNIVHENKMHPDLNGKSYTNYQFDATNTLRKKIYDEPKLFNVGYTITFSNNQDDLKKNPNVRLDDDIIIGTRSRDDVITIPSTQSPSTSEEIVLNEFLDGKKRKLSGIKPKYFRPLTHGLNPKHLIAQANLSPKTQLKLAELQISDATTSNSVINNENSEWKPLSSGVEIYHSNNIYSPSNKFYQITSRNSKGFIFRQ